MRRGLLLFSFHLLLGTAFMAYFSTFFEYTFIGRLALLFFHLIVNGSFWLVLLLGCGRLLKASVVTRSRLLTHLVRLVPAVTLHLILLLWLVDVIGIQHWGFVISFQIAAKVVSDFSAYYVMLLSAESWGLLLLLLVMGCGVYHRLTAEALSGWGEMLTASFQYLQKTQRRTRILAAGILVASFCVPVCGLVQAQHGQVSAALQHILPWYIWQREPLFSFFMLPLAKGVQGEKFFPATPRRLTVVESDAAERRNYPRPSFHAKNVILITVDCLRPDHFSFDGYQRETAPFLARLYGEGRLRKVAEMRSSSNSSHSGILSTLASRDYADLSRGLFLLPDLLKDQGYKVNFILSGQHTSWYDLRELYGHNIDFYFDGDQTRQFISTDDRLLFEGLEKVAPFDGQPAFFYFHLMSVHNFGIRLPEYTRWQPTLVTLGAGDWWRKIDQTACVNMYDNGLLMADATIERLFTELEGKGYLRNSLVMILGDHGQALGEHGNYGHGQAIYEEMLRIPLLIVDEPEVVYGNLSSALQLDVAPTIVDRLSLPVPKTWRGQSLLKPDQRQVSFHYRGFESGERAVIERDNGKVWKYIRYTAQPREELFELRSDPREEKNLAHDTSLAATLERLRDLMRKEVDR
jgi:hypothetical protein